MPLNKMLLPVTFLALVVYVITAWNSQGYFHPDEHYQIIEFSGLKLGTTTPEKLAWEYNKKMRPAIQPAICYIVFTTLDAAGMTDPYNKAFVLRLLSALLAITIIHFFIRSSQNRVDPKNRNVYYLLSYFLWFLPFLNVRFSSENWSGLFFLAAVAAIWHNQSKTTFGFLLTGAFAGCSFLCRFQSAFLLAGLILWLIFIARAKWRNLLALCFSGLVVILIGVLIDRWFYGEYIITSWNYFDQNFMHGVAATFGVAPWYRILSYIISLPGIPIGMLIFLALLMLIVKRPRDLLVWVIVPFLLAHIISPHKEGRFLFPLANFVPLVLIMGFQEMEKWPGLAKYRRTFYYPSVICFSLLVLINITGLFCAGFKAADNGRMVISQYIHEKYKSRNIQLICAPNCSPYNPFPGLPETFYREKSIVEMTVHSIHAINLALISDTSVTLFVINKSAMLPDLGQLNMPGFPALTLLKESIPNWEQWIDHHFYFRTWANDPLLLFSIK